jgi:hypothetical protein
MIGCGEISHVHYKASQALTGSEAFKIWKLAQDHGAFVMEACKYRHYPAIRRVESILSTGELGYRPHFGNLQQL